MDYEKMYNEARERAKRILCNLPEGAASISDIETIFPGLRESEDERIRKELVALFIEVRNSEGNEGYWHDLKVADILAWLEKQKEQKPIQTPKEKEYIRTLKSLISDFIRDKQPEDVAFYQKIYDWLDGRHIEQKPNIELIQRSWYMEGYHDREFGKEPKWIIKTGEGGPKHELNPKYGQMLEAEQKPVEGKEYSSPECGTTAGVWSDEDEKYLNRVINLWVNDFGEDSDTVKWLKSLRPVSKESLQPHWKPSEEQMEALEYVCRVYSSGGAEKSLYNNLKKLCEQLQELI